MKVGDKLYRVVDDGDDLRVQCVEIAAAGKKSFKLKRPFVGSFGVQFKPDTIGWLFHTSEIGALHAFIRSMQNAISVAQDRIAQHREFIAWAQTALNHREDNTP